MVNGDAATALKGGVPVTGNDAIEILENDHRLVKELFSRLVGASQSSEQSLVLDKLKAILTVHNATEENLVYPAVLVAASRAKDADALYHQQDEAKVGIWKLDAILKGSLKNEDFGKHAKELQESVLAHVRKEEETEFPHLRESLKGKELTQLTEAIREFRGKFRFEDASK
jgi:hemerythrin superfamily protein